MAVCRRCVAAGIRVESMPVFSGVADAEAILVGQAPGIREREIRRPFAWTAGERLRRWLEPAGLGTEEAFYGRLYVDVGGQVLPRQAAGRQ